MTSNNGRSGTQLALLRMYSDAQSACKHRRRKPTQQKRQQLDKETEGITGWVRSERREKSFRGAVVLMNIRSIHDVEHLVAAFNTAPDALREPLAFYVNRK